MTETIKYLITRFLEEMKFDLDRFVAPETTDGLLEAKSLRDWNTYVLDATVNAYGLKYLPLCCRISHMSYPDHPVEVKSYCAVYTLFHVLMDPLDHVGVHGLMVRDLEALISSFNDAKHLKDPLLGPFARYLAIETPLYFSPIQTLGLVKSSMDYVLGCLCEHEFPSGFSVSTEELPGWLRYKTGLGEPYAYFFLAGVEREQRDTLLPVVPLVTEYIQYVNDILSSYKEHCTAEDNNYLSHVSRALSLSTEDALAQLISKVRAIVGKIEMFCADRNLSGCAAKLIHGYIAWHILEDRYRLGELGIAITSQVRRTSGESQG